MERVRITILGLVGLDTIWLFLSLSFDSQNPAAAGGATRFDSRQPKAKTPEPLEFEAAIPLNGRIYCVTSGDDTGTDGGPHLRVPPPTISGSGSELSISRAIRAAMACSPGASTR
ncbi:MAG: hypothetical protein ACE15E_24060 [Acidobacteriota bacterium]